MIRICFLSIILLLSACGESEVDSDMTDDCQDESFFSAEENRKFMMGFTTWPFGPDIEDLSEIYDFIKPYADIYGEQIDQYIPWKAMMSGDDIPKVLLDNLKYRYGQARINMDLSLSISLLNLDRSDLLADIDGSVPFYRSLADDHIVDAYERYLSIVIEAFKPKYVVTAMEVNELYMHDQEKWGEYKIMASALRKRLKVKYPSTLFSESITLHNLYNSTESEAVSYIEDIFNYVNDLDFISVSYYPFLQGLKNSSDIEEAFDFYVSKWIYLLHL